jgi:hypothetical protein
MEQTASRATYFMLVSCLTCPSTLRMVATCSAETSTDFQLTIQRHISEDRTVQTVEPSSLVYAGNLLNG